MISLAIMQRLTRAWTGRAFTSNVVTNIQERVIRLMEETNESGQAEGITREQAHAIVDQVYDKEPGDAFQELGGVMICVTAYAEARGFSSELAWETEFNRINEPAVIDKIRAKQITKVRIVTHGED